MNKINYQKKLDKLIENLNGQVKSIMLHSCCAPCSSYCIEYLSNYFKLTVYYYNPNIYPRQEYIHRVKDQQRAMKKFRAPHGLDFIEGDYDTNSFYKIAGNRPLEGEGGYACSSCYRLRLKKTAEIAKEKGYDYFATTLSISPHKDSQVINLIGQEISNEYGIDHLPSDFKKKNGYKRSIELSDKLNLYRQDYCGCIFSKKERDDRLDRIEGEIREKGYKQIIVSGCSEECRHKDVCLRTCIK